MERLPTGFRRLARGAALMAASFLALALAGLMASPGRMRAVSGRVSILPLFPLVHVRGPQETFLLIQRHLHGVAVRFPHPGSVRLQLTLLGWLDLKPLVVDVVPPLRLVPGGQSIGVMLAPGGVVVERTVPVRDRAGRVRHPAREAGIEPGDIVLAADGDPVDSPEQLSRILARAAQAGRPVALSLLRGPDREQVRLVPVAGASPVREGEAGPPARFSPAGGMLVGDTAVGVGTLTFFEPGSGRFGALGHVVTRASRHPAPMPHGRIVRASIASLSPAGRGQPGEKVGIFRRQEGELGVIERNTPVGIFGRLLGPPAPGPYRSPIPVALRGQVREGPAVGLTVLEGEAIESFGLEIVRIRSLGVPESQRLVVRVTDPRLLARAGGIVQGMSGSPIIQGGWLVGAVTHVAVQDPTRGFGVMAEPMVEASGLWEETAGPSVAIPNTRVAA